VKTAIEYGSGSTFLGPLLNARISDAEFTDAPAEFLARDGVRLREKEQLYYYRSYREIFGPVSAAAAGKGDCPYCGTVLTRPIGTIAGSAAHGGLRPSLRRRHLRRAQDLAGEIAAERAHVVGSSVAGMREGERRQSRGRPLR
jgi:hypothetical protein